MCISVHVTVVRLMGTDPASREGRLEVFYSGAWGTVCDHSFSNISAQVACNILGFGYVLLIRCLVKSHLGSTGYKRLRSTECLFLVKMLHSVFSGVADDKVGEESFHDCHGYSSNLMVRDSVRAKLPRPMRVIRNLNTLLPTEFLIPDNARLYGLLEVKSYQETGKTACFRVYLSYLKNYRACLKYSNYKLKVR